MKQQYFEHRYRNHWQEFREQLQQLETANEPPSGKWYLNFVHRYRQLCHLQSIAAQRNYSRLLVDELNELVVQGHQQLYRHRSALGHSMLSFIFRDFPQLLRQDARTLWLAVAVFVVPGLLLFAGVLLKPELVYTVFSPEMVAEFESMYAPGNDKFGAARDAGTDMMMFGHYIQNNIGVAFRTFAWGVLLGVGTLFFLFYNSVIFGAIAAHLLSIGYAQTFFPFVIGHGSFELTAIVIAGVAGLKLGHSLVAPGDLSRTEALRKASYQSIRLMYGVIIMLVIAAFIEAFWSANGITAPAVKYAVGAFLWLIVIAYLTLVGRSGRAAR